MGLKGIIRTLKNNIELFSSYSDPIVHVHGIYIALKILCMEIFFLFIKMKKLKYRSGLQEDTASRG